MILKSDTNLAFIFHQTFFLKEDEISALSHLTTDSMESFWTSYRVYTSSGAIKIFKDNLEK